MQWRSSRDVLEGEVEDAASGEQYHGAKDGVAADQAEPADGAAHWAEQRRHQDPAQGGSMAEMPRERAPSVNPSGRFCRPSSSARITAPSAQAATCRQAPATRAESRLPSR